MSALLGFMFFEALRTVEDRRDVEILKLPKKPIIDSLDSVLSDIESTLKIRHIICHEGAGVTTSVSEEDAYRFLKAGLQFTNAVAWLISETLKPNGPLTPADERESTSAAPVVELPADAGKPLKQGIAICLSGGGYRAMLFHVGVLWRLAEAGYLGPGPHEAKFKDGTNQAIGNLERISSIERRGHLSPRLYSSPLAATDAHGLLGRYLSQNDLLVRTRPVRARYTALSCAAKALTLFVSSTSTSQL